MNVDVKARVDPGKSVTCEIRVGHARADVIFADGEITMVVPTAEGDVEISVPVPPGLHG